jgi:hypothetical protein
MRQSIRVVAVWAAILSFAAGSWLPSAAGPASADADGICGPVLAFGRTVLHFEASQPAPASGHCLFCHWRHTMATASAPDVVAVVRPADVARLPLAPPVQGAAVVAVGARVPRGPPSAA